MGAGAWKVTLRAVSEQDLPLLLAWRQDKEVMKYLPSAPKEPTWAMQWAWWQTRSNRLDYMVVLPKNALVPERPVGIVHYSYDTYEMGIIVGERASWGRGIAQDALSQFVKLARSLGHRRVWAAIHPENRASQVAFENVGFKKTGKTARNGQEEWVLR